MTRIVTYTLLICIEKRICKRTFDCSFLSSVVRYLISKVEYVLSFHHKQVSSSLNSETQTSVSHI